MSVGKVTEITSKSKKSFDDAIAEGAKRASKTIKNLKSAWVKDQHVELNKGKIVAYCVTMKLTFVLE